MSSEESIGREISSSAVQQCGILIWPGRLDILARDQLIREILNSVVKCVDLGATKDLVRIMMFKRFPQYNFSLLARFTNHAPIPLPCLLGCYAVGLQRKSHDLQYSGFGETVGGYSTFWNDSHSLISVDYTILVRRVDGSFMELVVDEAHSRVYSVVHSSLASVIKTVSIGQVYEYSTYQLHFKIKENVNVENRLVPIKLVHFDGDYKKMMDGVGVYCSHLDKIRRLEAAAAAGDDLVITSRAKLLTKLEEALTPSRWKADNALAVFTCPDPVGEMWIFAQQILAKLDETKRSMVSLLVYDAPISFFYRGWTIAQSYGIGNASNLLCLRNGTREEPAITSFIYSSTMHNGLSEMHNRVYLDEEEMLANVIRKFDVRSALLCSKDGNFFSFPWPLKKLGKRSLLVKLADLDVNDNEIAEATEVDDGHVHVPILSPRGDRESLNGIDTT